MVVTVRIVLRDASRCVIDVAFQEGDPSTSTRMPWFEAAAKAHEFVAHLLRAFASSAPASGSNYPRIPAIYVEDRHEGSAVRIETDERDWQRDLLIVEAAVSTTTCMLKMASDAAGSSPKRKK